MLSRYFNLAVVRLAPSPAGNPRRSRHAFTLVELLVVIGIIAVLIGILLPTLSKARAHAQEVQCMSNLHQWGLGYTMYVDQNHGQLPMKPPDGTTAQPFTLPTGPGNAEIQWTDASGSHWIPFPSGIDDMGLFFNAIPTMIGGKSYYQLLLDDKNGRSGLPTAGSNNLFICPAGAPTQQPSRPDLPERPELLRVLRIRQFRPAAA